MDFVDALAAYHIAAGHLRTLPSSDYVTSPLLADLQRANLIVLRASAFDGKTLGPALDRIWDEVDRVDSDIREAWVIRPDALKGDEPRFQSVGSGDGSLHDEGQ